MQNNSVPFYRTNSFKLFITVWVVYVFYLQMFGSSSMANTQSALTAAIVNEGRFEIDTYYKAGGNGNAFYNGHYYSGQAPGISFVSVPVYFASKQFFYLVPDSTIDFLFEKLEEYGKGVSEDWQGEKKVLSNFFPALSRRQILEYVIISGFILPIFTTSLIAAISAVLLYSLLGELTKDPKLRMAAALLYAFGTLMFPLSTEFFERPIAISLMFLAFIILFRVKHKKIKPKKSSLLAAGVLAGIAVWFDYFHLFIAGILFLYLASFFGVSRNIKAGKIWQPLKLNLTKKDLTLMFSFAAGAIIPILLLGLYQYIVFGNPLTTSYTYRFMPEKYSLQVSGLSHIALPNEYVLFHMSVFLLYSPIIILALYGLLKAFFKRDKYFEESFMGLMIVIATFIFSVLLVLSYYKNPSTLIEFSFKRYMKPMLPYAMMFLPYAFQDNKIGKKGAIKVMLIVFGAISIFMNWLSAQYGGHSALGHFELETGSFVFIERLFETGPSSSFLSALSGIFNASPLLLNSIGLITLLLVLCFIWKPRFRKDAYRNSSR